MSESVTRKPEDVPASIASLRSSYYGKTDKKDKKEAKDVPRWVKSAFAKVDILGMTYKEVAAEFNKSPQTLASYNVSPWVKEWRRSLQEFADDPVAMATAIIRGSVLEAALDQLWAIETAKRTGDYKEVRLGTKDILATHNVIQASNTQKSDHRVMIQINLGQGDLEAPEATVIEAEFEEIDVPEATWELPEEERGHWDPIDK